MCYLTVLNSKRTKSRRQQEQIVNWSNFDVGPLQNLLKGIYVNCEKGIIFFSPYFGMND